MANDLSLDVLINLSRNLIRQQQKMAAYAAMKPTKAGLEEPQEPVHKIRITLSSKNVKNLEKGANFHTLFGWRFYVFFWPFWSSILPILMFICLIMR